MNTSVIPASAAILVWTVAFVVAMAIHHRRTQPHYPCDFLLAVALITGVYSAFVVVPLIGLIHP